MMVKFSGQTGGMLTNIRILAVTEKQYIVGNFFRQIVRQTERGRIYLCAKRKSRSEISLARGFIHMVEE